MRFRQGAFHRGIQFTRKLLASGQQRVLEKVSREEGKGGMNSAFRFGSKPDNGVDASTFMSRDTKPKDRCHGHGVGFGTMDILIDLTDGGEICEFDIFYTFKTSAN